MPATISRIWEPTDCSKTFKGNKFKSPGHARKWEAKVLTVLTYWYSALFIVTEKNV